MKVGLVLASTPAYSETFFLTKIKGLKASGFDVTLFAQRNENDFSLCRVTLAPKVNMQNTLFQSFKIVIVLFELVITYPKRVFKFITLEKKSQQGMDTNREKSI